MLVNETQDGKSAIPRQVVIIGDNYVHFTLFRCGFLPGKLLFLKRNLRHLRIRYFVETCV